MPVRSTDALISFGALAVVILGIFGGFPILFWLGLVVLAVQVARYVIRMIAQDPRRAASDGDGASFGPYFGLDDSDRRDRPAPDRDARSDDTPGATGDGGGDGGGYGGGGD